MRRGGGGREKIDEYTERLLRRKFYRKGEEEGYALKLAEKQFHFVGASHRIFLISSSMELNFSMKNDRYSLSN